VPDRQLTNQLRLVEAVAFALGGEVRQAVQSQSCFGALASLPLDRLDRPPRGCLRRGHPGGGQRLHRHRETVRKRDLVRL
jgi:hypothetical protein